MTIAAAPSLISRVVNQVLAIKPLWNWARGQARTMMIKRAESIGVDWQGRLRGVPGDHGYEPRIGGL